MESSALPSPPTARRLSEGSTDQSKSPPPSPSRASQCLISHNIPTNALSHSVALIRPCIWLWAFLVGLASLVRAAFYHYSGRTQHRTSSPDEPRTRPRPSPSSSRRSSNEKVPTSAVAAAGQGGEEDSLAVSSGFSTLGRYISTSARRFHSTLRPPAVLKMGGLYHELDQVAETDEELVPSAPPASPVGPGSESAAVGGEGAAANGRAADEERAPAAPRTRSTPARQSSGSEHDQEGDLTEDGGSSDGASEACTVDDYRGLPQLSPSAGKKGFAAWFSKPLRRRGSSDPSRSDTSLSATSGSSDFAPSLHSTASSTKSHCPSQLLADRRQAKKNRAVTSPLPTRPCLRTAATTPAAPGYRSSARSPSPIPSLSLNRPRSTSSLRSASLDGLVSYPSPTLARGPEPTPVSSVEWQPASQQPKRSNTLGSKLRARSPFSTKVRSPLSTPPASPTLSPTVPGFAFLRRKSWDADRLDKGTDEGRKSRSSVNLATTPAA